MPENNGSDWKPDCVCTETELHTHTGLLHQLRDQDPNMTSISDAQRDFMRKTCEQFFYANNNNEDCTIRMPDYSIAAHEIVITLLPTLASLLLNSWLIAALVKGGVRQSKTCILLCAICVADMLYAPAVGAEILWARVHSGTPLSTLAGQAGWSRFVCYAVGLLQSLCRWVMVATLCALAAEKFMVVKYPLVVRRHFSRTKCVLLVAGIWMFGAGAAGASIGITTRYDPDIHRCLSVGQAASSWLSLVFLFVVPLALQCYFYGHVIAVLRKSRGIEMPQSSSTLVGQSATASAKRTEKVSMEPEISSTAASGAPILPRQQSSLSTCSSLQAVKRSRFSMLRLPDLRTLHSQDDDDLPSTAPSVVTTGSSKRTTDQSTMSIPSMGESTKFVSRQYNEKRRKAVNLLLLILLVYVFCFLPAALFRVVVAEWSGVFQRWDEQRQAISSQLQYLYHMRLYLTVLQMMHSGWHLLPVLNPVLMIVMSRDIRQTLRAMCRANIVRRRTLHNQGSHGIQPPTLPHAAQQRKLTGGAENKIYKQKMKEFRRQERVDSSMSLPEPPVYQPPEEMCSNAYVEDLRQDLMHRDWN